MSNEQSIRDELANVVKAADFSAPDSSGSSEEFWHVWKNHVADQIMASPVIRRIQAEAGAKALERAADAINKDFQSLPSWDATYKAGERTEDWENGCTRTLVDTMDWLRARAASIRADRIERGETA